MEEPEMQLKGKKVTDKFTESVYVLANEPSVALYRLQEHVRRSLPELAQHKADMQRWEEQSQGAIYTVEYACRCHCTGSFLALAMPKRFAEYFLQCCWKHFY
ncbi:BLOC-1-related complex subunit 8 isoform X5 [Bubalus kerabau]|uniref:BLOC-1-related complex subunit 8 isoform X5 n=1 Tax=Bubalus carabanensis TaxID=3119969 RepID=UPI00244E6503|nr:BLOC-1-related complex subunit 8 isoform X5 [Bubalus carabanensis]